MIVADANVTAYLLLEGKYTQQAAEVYRKDNHWLVPPVWRHEFANIMVKYARDQGNDIERYRVIYREAERYVDEAEIGDMRLAIDLAVRYGLSAYDAEYYYIAKMHRVPLVTEDKRILKAVPGIAFSMEAFLRKDLK